MELLQVEAAPERLLSLGPRPRPGHVPHLVAARLPRLGAVALDLPLRARLREAGGGDEIVGRLLAAPLLRVEAGVDHQPRRPEQEGLEVTRPLERRLVGAELVRELLGVERPAFRIGAEEAGLAKRRYVLRFLGEADLEVMARHA